MTEAIFPWYILHQTITVMAGYWLTRQDLSVWIEAPLVILATFGGCALLHELVIRRVGFLRPLFGLKPARQTTAGARNPRKIIQPANTSSNAAPISSGPME
jgi:hypothetical protein